MAKNFREALTLSIPTIPPLPLAGTPVPTRQRAGLSSGQRWMVPTARGLVRALELRDVCTGRHSRRVASMSLRLAECLGCDDSTKKSAFLGGLLHDIGKIGLDDEILKKQGALSDCEQQRMSKHPELGCAIIEGVPTLEEAVSVVLHHHENWDGSGYPFGMKGSQIPLAARICAVVDSFDAMSTVRPYRSAMPDEQVDAILRAGAKRQWDPAVVAAYWDCREELRAGIRRMEHGGRMHHHVDSTDSPVHSLHGSGPSCIPHSTQPDA